MPHIFCHLMDIEINWCGRGQAQRLQRQSWSDISERESTHHASIEKQDQAVFVWKLGRVNAHEVWKPGQFVIEDTNRDQKNSCKHGTLLLAMRIRKQSEKNLERIDAAKVCFEVAMACLSKSNPISFSSFSLRSGSSSPEIVTCFSKALSMKR